MLDTLLREKYKKLQERERKYRRYRKPASWISASLIWIVFVVFCVVVLGIFVFDVQFSIFVLYGLILSWQLIGLLIVQFLKKKANVYNLGSDEWAMFYSCSILENIQNYLESKPSKLKQEYRKNAVRSSKKLLSSIEKHWKIGDFKLARTIFGDTISKLKGNFRIRLIPNLEEGDKHAIKEVEKVIYSFVHYALNPSVENFGHLNKMMLDRLSRYEPKKLGFHERCSSFLVKHTVLKHVLVTVAFGLVSYFVFLIGISYVQISKDGSFVAAITLFGVLLAGYWQRGK